MSRHPKLLSIVVALLIALAGAGDASARAGGGGSFGSRGSRSFSLPPVTRTAPRPAAPVERPVSPSSGSFAPAARSGGFFSSSFGRGFAGGLLGAGLFGLLSGNGLFGGIGSGMSFLGLLIQIGLIVLIVRFVIGLFHSRRAAGVASRGSTSGAVGGAPTGGAWARNGSSRGPVQTAPLQTDPADFDMFQRRLAEIQGAYSAEDIGTLRRLSTPEMASRLTDEITENQRRGASNRLSDVCLLQGDLAEAWSEGTQDYATVAMRYSLHDVMVDRGSGRVVSGNADRPDEVTELWTFTRRSGSGPAGWVLSAIQQT